MDALTRLAGRGSLGGRRNRQRFAPVQPVFVEESQQGRSGLGQHVQFAALFR